MPLGISCLFKNTAAIAHIESAIKVLVGERIKNGGNATFPEIYKEIRSQGVEVDAQTLGTIYNGIYGKYSVNELSTIGEVENFAGIDFENQMESLKKAAMGEDEEVDVKKIGKLSPEKSVVNAISKIFQRENFTGTPAVKSALKSMEDLVSKAANSLLEKSKKKGVNVQEALQHFFDIESNKFEQVDGTLNTLETLTSAVKKEVKNYVDKLTEDMDDADAETVKEKWDAYTKAFVDSVYDITLNKSNQSQLVTESLKQVKIDGVNIVDVNGNVKWSALIEYGNPESIAEKVSDLFYNGVKDKAGNTTQYTREQSDRIGEYFLREYKTRLAAATARTTGNNRAKNMTAKNIISDFLKDRGFFDLVKDKNGKLLLTKVDWDTLLNRISAQVGSRTNEGDTSAIDLMKVELNKYLSGLKKQDGSPKFNSEQKAIIEKEFIDTVTAKLEPATGESNDMERLIALSQLNGGNAFNAATQTALNKVAGLSNIQQVTLDKIQALAVLAGNIMNGVNTPQGTATQNTSVNRGAYAFQALSEIDRKIKELLIAAKTDASQTQKVTKYLADLMGSATTTLLLNPNNAIENVTTGVVSNLTESVNMLFANPKLFFKSIGGNQKDFWVTWANYALGGAYSEITNESDIENDIQSSERLRVRTAINEIKDKGSKGVLSVILQSPQLAVSIFSRATMNSFDAAFNSAILRKRMIMSTYNAIRSQGASSNGKTAFEQMDKVFNVDNKINTELEKEANRIFVLMENAGFPVTETFKAQTKRDLKLSLYEDVMQDVAADKSASLRQATEATSALISASQAQSKTLTGKKQLKANDPLTRLIYGFANAALTPQKATFQKSREAEQKGNLAKGARLQAAATIMQNTYGKFLGGAANFLALGITATPLGIMPALSLYSQSRELEAKGADVLKGDPNDVKRYAEMSGMARSIAARTIVGSTALAMFILKNWGYDDEDDNKDDGLANLMQTKTGRRLMQKHLPMAVNLAAACIYESGDSKKSNALDNFMQAFSTYTGKDFDAYSNLMTGLKYAKTDDDKKEVWVKAMGSMLPTYNLNQAEQLTKFKDVAGSFFDKDKISDVQANQEVSKEMYKSVEGMMDAYFVNGGVDAMQRFFSKEPFNRFNQK